MASQICKSIPGRQKGIVVIATTVAMLALLLVAGYALSSGHILLNKTRLQNMVDSAALSAAKVLDQTNDTSLARQAGFDALTTNLAEAGYKELATAIADGAIGFEAEFSNTLLPFDPASPNPRFVRISFTDNIPLNDFFLIGNKFVNATAVSGPSPILAGNVCNIAPLMACGENNPDNYYGYDTDEVTVMKYAAGDSSEVGSGNFQLIRLPGGQGGAAVRENLAGGYDDCLSAGDDIETEPGNTVGPVVQGLNLRFGVISGGSLDPTVYQPDFVTDSESHFTIDDINDDGSLKDPDKKNRAFNHKKYKDRYSLNQYDVETCPGDPQCYRRRLTVPIGDCSGTTNGQGIVPLYGFACFYLLQPVNQKGNEAQVFGQFVEGCNNSGSFLEDPGTGPAPTRIILYKDPDSLDS